jgi:hypothetical protein
VKKKMSNRTILSTCQKRTSTMRKSLVIVLLATGTLVGCHSFNHYIIPDVHILPVLSVEKPIFHPAMASGVVAKEALPPTVRKSESLCGQYQPPHLPPPPVLPIKELAATPMRDWEGLDRIQIKHIEDLRAYIVEVRTINAAAYKKYLKSCATSSTER